MARRVFSKEELLEAWRKQEKEIKRANDERQAEREFWTTHCCRNCEHSFYRYVPPTGTFTEPSEFCGCHKKVDLVDPNGVCQDFSLR